MRDQNQEPERSCKIRFDLIFTTETRRTQRGNAEIHARGATLRVAPFTPGSGGKALQNGHEIPCRSCFSGAPGREWRPKAPPGRPGTALRSLCLCGSFFAFSMCTSVSTTARTYVAVYKSQAPEAGIAPPSSFQSVSLNLPSPHFSPAFYCGGGSGHVYCVALGRSPRRTVEYACGALPSRAL